MIAICSWFCSHEGVIAVMKGLRSQLLPCLLIYLFLCIYLMSSDTFHVASCIFLCSRSTLNIIMQLWLMRNFWSNDFRRQDSLLENVRIWSYSRPHFSAFGLNMETYGVILRIDFKCGKMWTRKTPNTDTFFPYLRWTYLLRLMFVRTSNHLNLKPKSWQVSVM